MLRITNRQIHSPKHPAGLALAYYRRVLCNPFLDTCIVQLQENFASTSAKALLINALMPAFCLERDFSAIEEGVTMYLQFLPGILNLALGGIASQSSTHGHYAAARAIDGNTNGDMFKQSCTHTKQTDDPWWMITFKYMILAHEVLIVNRDECCGKRLNNFSIMVGPYLGKYQKCGSSTNNMIREKKKSFKCTDDAKGSTLKITNRGKNKVLSLCEVFVYGTVIQTCDSIPCKHGGKCSNLGITYKCSCRNNYVGTNCESSRDDVDGKRIWLWNTVVRC
ncbi:hypothetical protein LSAT2_001912 [Lamellibrachia satsuma]|nr:hypothetical protein LSAT2_001912 [Lamellibrachia satsuma]